MTTLTWPTNETLRIPIRGLRAGMVLLLPQGGGMIYDRIDTDPVRVDTRRVSFNSTQVSEDGEPIGESLPQTRQGYAMVRIVVITFGQYVSALLLNAGLASTVDVISGGTSQYATIVVREPHRWLPADSPRILGDVWRALWHAGLFATCSREMVIAALDEPGRAAARRMLTRLHGDATTEMLNGILDETISGRIAAEVLRELDQRKTEAT